MTRITFVLFVIILVISILFPITSRYSYADPPHEAEVSYIVNENARGTFTYTLRIANTGAEPYSIYSWRFGQSLATSSTNPSSTFRDVDFIYLPEGWYGVAIDNFGINFDKTAGGIDVRTNVKRGEIAAFVFRSSTPPDPSYPVVVCFYNKDDGSTGYCHDITANRREEQVFVPVIVGLNMQFTYEGWLLEEDDIKNQREQIKKKQEELLQTLPRSGFVGVPYNYTAIPFIAMNIDESTLRILRSSPLVMSIEDDLIMKPFLSDTIVLVGANNTWPHSTGRGQTVAILDTGVDKNNPLLSGKVVSEACFSNRNSDQNRTAVCPNAVQTAFGPDTGMPCTFNQAMCTHGTFVAAIAGGDTATVNQITYHGIARDANIIAIQVFARMNDPSRCFPDPTPCTRTDSSSVVAGLDHVASHLKQHKVSAVNLSLGNQQFTSHCDRLLPPDSPAYAGAINQLHSLKVATIAAAGNNATSPGIAIPACIENAISVGATTKNDRVAPFSQYAPVLDLLAPGASVVVPINNTSTNLIDGTSFATAHVTGAWALLKFAYPSASVDRVFDALNITGIRINDTRIGAGMNFSRIQIYDAFQYIIQFPHEPTGISATELCQAVKLNWLPPAYNGTSSLTGYRIEGTITPHSRTFSTITIVPANQTSYEDKTLHHGTKYYYRVIAINSVGESEPSIHVKAKTKEWWQCMFGSAGSKGNCLIATAAYGTELAPQVQILREFRDKHIMSTASGSGFMNVFNAWYYSFSPYVADYERQQPWLRETVKILIYPLLGILQLSERGYSSIDGEYGALTAGLIASSMIGVLYFWPFALPVRRVREGRFNYKLIVSVLAAVSVALISSILFDNVSALMVTTSLFVLTTVTISAILFARVIVNIAKQVEAKFRR